MAAAVCLFACDEVRVEIRAGNAHDLSVCLKMDTTFETEYVWQMEARQTSGDIALGFHLSRLPRPVKAQSGTTPERVAFDAQNGGTLFVADDAGEILGFADVTVSEWNQAAQINQIAVALAHRRKGIGTRLMRAIITWARQKHLRAVLLDAPTKAHPAIRLAQKQGLVFCGYHDQFYPNRDITLFFALNLR